MKEMWTGVYPTKKEYKYEVRFRTDCKPAYEFVQEACRYAIDVTWTDEAIAESEENNEKI